MPETYEPKTLLKETERNRILFDWNQTYSAYAKNKVLAELFEEQVARLAESTALNYKDHSLSYGQLNEKANQLAYYLRELGVKNNCLVAVCLEPSIDLFIAILAILKAGGAYVPLDPDNPIARQKVILEHCNATALITHEHYITRFEGCDAKTVFIDSHQIFEKYQTNNLPLINNADDLAYVIYTSGSTGTPKGVMISHRNINHFTHWFNKALNTSSRDIFDFSSSISFDFSVATSLFPLLIGAQVAICPESERRDTYLYLQHLTTSQASIIKMTPSHFRRIKDVVLNDQIPLRLSYVIFGGETLFANDIKDWLAQFPTQTMFCEYGPTEATIAASWIKVDKHNIHRFEKKIPIGKPALNTQLYILDEKYDPVANGNIGELYISGDGVALGYLHQPDATAQKFIANPYSDRYNKKSERSKMYKTGDFCRYLQDGNIEFVERADHQVKIRGFRVETEEIEHIIASHPDIQETAVIVQALPKQIAEKYLIAYCVMKQDKHLDPHALREYLLRYLPEHMVPSFFEVVGNMPIAASGKIDKRQLPKPKQTEVFGDHQPSNDLEKQLHAIWCQVLHRENIKVNDNLFDLGGNSLTAAMIIAKIHNGLKKEISLQNVYDYPTISALAELTERADDIIVAPQTTRGTHTTKTIPLNELQFMFWVMGLAYPNARIQNIIERKRITGIFDLNKLNHALACICKKYPILSYRFPKFKPVQIFQELSPLQVKQTDLKDLPRKTQEEILIASYTELEKMRWQKGHHLFAIHLYLLNENTSEIQIGIAHNICDEISIKILSAEMTKFYLQPINRDSISPEHIQYKDTIFHEKYETTQNFKKHVDFWRQHLQDAGRLIFPPENRSKQAHTLYLPITEELITRLQTKCMTNRLSVSDVICSAIGMTMKPYLTQTNQLVLNVVKSTRDNDLYENCIGLFIRTDMLKMDLSEDIRPIQLAKQVQRTTAEILKYQTCPTIVKLACFLQADWQRKPVRDWIGGALARIYALLFYASEIDWRVIQMFFRVFLANTKEQFFIDVNIMNNFVNKEEAHTFCGYQTLPVDDLQNDVTVDDNILNIWFDRDGNNHPTVIFAGNLQSDFLTQLGASFLDKLETNYG